MVAGFFVDSEDGAQLTGQPRLPCCTMLRIIILFEAARPRYNKGSGGREDVRDIPAGMRDPHEDSPVVTAASAQRDVHLSGNARKGPVPECLASVGDSAQSQRGGARQHRECI